MVLPFVASAAPFAAPILVWLSTCVALLLSTPTAPVAAPTRVWSSLSVVLPLFLGLFATSSHPFGLVVELLSSASILSCVCSRWSFAVELPLFLFAVTMLHHFPLDFDSTLGFPGEGWFLFRLFVVMLVRAMATISPATPAEHDRARRREPVQLVADRVVRPATRSNRAKLLEAFDLWLTENHGTTTTALFAMSGDVAERISTLLVGYGQALFRAGLPYYKYSETINAVASAKPSIRRGLGSGFCLVDRGASLSSQGYASRGLTRFACCCTGLGLGSGGCTVW